ncbi:hypothetical protein [Paractinoplanes rishiriensis]|uniref:hypothetical protein n=1 Tax=Paractinoplanes rishiriensis TaxID=1050105 RepID=UPI00194149C6|nr:hypothetical protein [Actinoplanes rishiriensis]
MVATLLEAVKHQRARCPEHFAPDGRHGLHVRRDDLRQYRRDRTARRHLVLVIDHTCRRGWDWGAALAPYLRAAYASRSPVDVIEVGAAGAPAEARATSLRLAGVLDPRMDAVLTRAAGRATPLAHGLDLAATALRRALRRDRHARANGFLVVLTDGLGNVPRAASEAGQLPDRAGAEGVRDALASARGIRSLQRVGAVLLAPPAVAHESILRRLAASLGATVVRPGGGDG